MMMRPLACALTLQVATSQQLVIPGVTDGGGCDLGTLPERVQQVDDLCCFETAGNPGARCARGVSCDVPCAETLLPFLSNCSAVINKLFDVDDGIDDDIAGQFDSVYGACMEIDPTEALAALSDLKDSGHCTDAQLDGVAETPVSAAPCADVRPTCANLIASGFMTCVADFGPTGDLAGQCDRTCAFCGTQAGGRHRLQTAMQCDLVHFPEQAAAVDAACCDDGVSCAAGVPTTCDAKCAVVFPRFFESCRTTLQTQVDRNTFNSYERLHDTCTTGLPVEPLLRAAAVCSAGPAIASATIIVIGGQGDSGRSSLGMSSGERYDPAANAWSPIASMGTVRYYHAAAAIDGLLYAIGGEDDSGSTLSSGERFDPASNAWSPIASMGTARESHAAAVIDGLLYAIGGYETYDGEGDS
eukprot:COSAG02_NODE_6797_length_3355_cov_2.061732_1_plen_413_part_10